MGAVYIVRGDTKCYYLIGITGLTYSYDTRQEPQKLQEEGPQKEGVSTAFNRLITRVLVLTHSSKRTGTEFSFPPCLRTSSPL